MVRRASRRRSSRQNNPRGFFYTLKTATIKAAKGVGSASKKAAKGVVSVSKTAAKGVTKVTKSGFSEMTELGGSAFKKVYGLIDDESDEEIVDG